MEIDTRFPTPQASQPLEARDGETQTPPPAALVGSGSDSEFFISPVLRFDSRSLTVIFQVRDSHSGDVVRQFPPEAVVERYRQDPTAKPFVLSARSASGQEDDPEAADEELLAPFLPEEGRSGISSGTADTARSDTATPDTSPSETDGARGGLGSSPVDLVA